MIDQPQQRDPQDPEAEAPDAEATVAQAAAADPAMADAVADGAAGAEHAADAPEEAADGEPELEPGADEPTAEAAADQHAQSLRLIEALIFASAQPLDVATLSERLPEDCDVEGLLAELAEMYAGRGVNLARVAGGFTFRTAPDLAQKMRIETQVTRKLSRAAVETLAIIAYHQPVTRAEIEQIRGVGISKGTFDFLFEHTWIRPMGRRRAPGKPVTWGTTDFFLEHFGLSAIEDLPGMEELKAAGLLDPRAQPSIYRPEEPDLPLTDEAEDGAAEPLEAGEDAPVKAAD